MLNYGSPGYALPPGTAFRFQHDWIPVGMIMPFSGLITPPGQQPADPPEPGTDVEAWGWMVCDGRSLKVSEYPYLFNALGFLYTENGSPGDENFNIPDYQGYFLRALDPDSKRDKDARTAPPGGTESDPGSTQNFALQTHAHQYDKASSGPGGTGTGAIAIPQQWTGTPTSPNQPPPGSVEVSDTETRPVNIAVNYLIKYTHMQAQNPGPAPLPGNPLTRLQERRKP